MAAERILRCSQSTLLDSACKFDCSYRNKRLSFFFALFTMLLALLSANALAQPDPVKWGEVSRDVLALTEYPEDHDAHAVILVDYGYSKFDKDLNIVFDRHRMIKILDEGGYDWGTHHVSYYAFDNCQRVKNLKGQTIFLDDNGEIQKHKLDKKSIFNEVVDDKWRRVRFTMPALRPGAVIEYRYTIVYERPGDLPDWSFQSSEPTLWSEYRADIPEFYNYVTSLRGSEPLDDRSSKIVPATLRWTSKSRNVGNWIPTGTKFETYTLDYNLALHRWVNKKVPALRAEKYMTTLDDYRSKLRFQLSMISFPGQPDRPVLESWEKLSEDLEEHADFGKQLNRYKSIRQQAADLILGIEEPNKKMLTLYDYVKTTMEWDGDFEVLAETNLDDALKQRKGTSAEINLLLASMLRMAGLEAAPVLLSTRKHGMIQKAYPIVQQFNHVIVCVRIDNQEYLLDATDPLRPYDLLPEADLNGEGRVIDGASSRWVTIPSRHPYQEMIMVGARLSEDGSLDCEARLQAFDYSALYKRRLIREYGVEEYVKDYLCDNYDDATVESARVANLDTLDRPLELLFSFKIPEAGMAMGDFIYLNPVLINRLSENPFKMEERTFPVDYAYPYNTSYVISLTGPDPFVVHEIPSTDVVRLPDDASIYGRFTEAEESTARYETQFRMNKTHYKTKEYTELKEYYNRILDMESAQIVFKRR